MSTVYFLQCTETQKIKIGHAGDVAQRIREIQVYSPTELRPIALAVGGREREAELHRRYAAVRSHGEWFYPTYALLKFIRENCQICSPYFTADPWSLLDRSHFLDRTLREQRVSAALDVKVPGRKESELRSFQLMTMGRVSGGWLMFPEAETVADVCAQSLIDANVLELDWAVAA